MMFENSVFDFGSEAEPQDIVTEGNPDSVEPAGNGDEGANTEPEPEPEPSEEEDFITTILKQGKIDRNAVRFFDGKENTTIPFDELSNKEKLQIINSINTPDISDDEISAINFLRANKMTLQDFANWQRSEAIKEAQKDEEAAHYKGIDTLDDEALYRFDLLERYPDMTDEEIEQEMQIKEANPALYNKKIASLRESYKQLAQEELSRQEDEQQAQAEAAWQEYANQIIGAANNTQSINYFNLTDEDKKDVVSFLLERDANGQSEFYKLCNDPEALFKMAWYMKNGDRAVDSLVDYYKKEIKDSRRQDPNKPTVAKKDKKTTTNDIFDLQKQYNSLK